MEFAEYYSYNNDGSVRGELVTKIQGVIPFECMLKMFGVDLTDKMCCNKAQFRGMLLDRKYVNDDGIACDKTGKPLEDQKTYAPLSDVQPEKWDKCIYLNRDGSSALDEEGWSTLSPAGKKAYRKVPCIAVTFSAKVPLEGVVYLCKEAVVIMSGLLWQDICIGDPINNRYLHECRYNEAFAAQYGFVVHMAMEDWRMMTQIQQEAQEAAKRIARVITAAMREEDNKPTPEQ